MSNNTKKLIECLNKSHSPFHVVETIKEILAKEEEICLCNSNKETSPFRLFKKDDYDLFVYTRNDSSIAVGKMSHNIKAEDLRFNFMSAHTDSPTFKVKPNPIYKTNNLMMLNVEPYGGLIANTWFDRPLTVAGRVVYSNDDNQITSELVHIDKNLLNIPNLAIHMSSDINRGHKYDYSKDTIPLLGIYDKDIKFEQILVNEINSKTENKIKTEDVLGFDIFLETREKAELFGLNNEFIISPKLDDLGCVYGCLNGLCKAKPADNVIDIAVFFDNEEVGSLTRQGANSTFFEDLLEYVSSSLNLNKKQFLDSLAKSFMVSADNAHATHPNYTEKADRTSVIQLGKGIVVKTAASQTYTTDAFGAAVVKYICKGINKNIQEFTNRSDMRGGSTLGNISNAHISVPSVDIGLPQLAMHSANEMCAISDYDDLVDFANAFYSSNICLNFKA